MQGIIHIDKEKVLKFKGKRSKNKKDGKRGQIPNRKFLDERSEKANARQEIVRWEGDLVIGKDRKGGLLTLGDRHSRCSIVEKIEGKSAVSIVKTLMKC